MSDYRCSKCGLRCDRADGHMGAGECRDALKAEVERLRTALGAQGQHSHDAAAALRQAREALNVSLPDDEQFRELETMLDSECGSLAITAGVLRQMRAALRAADEVLGE